MTTVSIDRESTQPISTPGASGQFPRGTVALLMLMVGCAHFNRIAISVAGTERIMPQYEISPDKMGFIYSAFLLFYTFMQLPGGWFIDRFGARFALTVLGFGATIFVAMTGAVGLIGTQASTVFMGLLIVRSLLGTVNAPLHPASATMVCDRIPAGSRMIANGMVTFAACVGISIVFYAMGALIDTFDWPIAFLVSSAVTLAITAIWTVGTRDRNATRQVVEPNNAADQDQSTLARVLRSRSVVCVTLSYTAMSYFQYLFFYWIEYYFETIQHQGRNVGRGYSTMITLAMGLGMISGGWLADRVPKSLSPWTRRAIVPMLGMIGSGAVFDLGLLAPDIKITLFAFAVSAALLGACEGIFWTTAVELGGRFGGTVAGMMNTGGNAGGTLSPYITPLLGGFFTSAYGADLGWKLSLAVAGGIAIVGAALWIGVSPPRPLEAGSQLEPATCQ